MSIGQLLAEFKLFLLGGIWLVFHYLSFARQLSERFNVKALRPIRLNHWQRGVRYFKGRTNASGAVFIKTDGVHKLLRREVAAANIVVASGGARAIPRVLFFCLDGPYEFAGFEWLDGKDLDVVLREPDFALSGAFLGREIMDLVGVLAAAKLIHRDITPKNLFMCCNPSGEATALKLLDFAFAVDDNLRSFDEAIPESVFKDLGFGFKPAPLTWDDAYSFKVVAGCIEQSKGLRLGELRRWLDERIGDRVFTRAAS